MQNDDCLTWFENMNGNIFSCSQSCKVSDGRTEETAEGDSVKHHTDLYNLTLKRCQIK